jgi:hypothetical protein
MRWLPWWRPGSRGDDRLSRSWKTTCWPCSAGMGYRSRYRNFRTGAGGLTSPIRSLSSVSRPTASLPTRRKKTCSATPRRRTTWSNGGFSTSRVTTSTIARPSWPEGSRTLSGDVRVG